MASGRDGRKDSGRRDSSRGRSRDRMPERNLRSIKTDSRRKEEPKSENKFLDSVLGVVFFIAVGVSQFFKKLTEGENKGYLKYTYIAIGVIIVSFAGYLIYWANTNKNAQTVYLDTVKIGTVKIPKDGPVEAAYIEELAITKIMNEVGANVDVNEKVLVESVHAKDSDLVNLDYVVGEIAKRCTYKVEAASITVDGKEMAIVASDAIYREITESIKKTYYQEGLNITGAEFVEDVKATLVYVEKNEVMSRDEAYSVLTAYSQAQQVYEIKSGDALDTIAANAGMKREELLAINPGYTAETVLKIGEKLNLSVSKPLLSVKTFEPTTYPEVIPKKIEKRYTDSLNRGEERIIQQGRDGQQEVTANIIRINGYEEKERDIINTKITIEPITEIVEVGTR